ncbi:hypothetical protein KUTeg_009465 [Tegillarca granosa]|uniref:Uncharacterized protein n=1 Tax=Tegillarca granosa TaxID=220873 RepID=A0ABQ9F736_TEGGR|nr:hypothetical protein KUTeg_009465 [Tegillarca granosa]
MSDSSYKEDVEIPRSNGVPCNLPERMKKELSDLDILGSNVCKLQDESLTEKEREDLQQEFSEKFYSGEQAAWLNFYYPNQVLPREKSGELRRMISTSLISEIKDPEECVRSVAIYHQPGAGGTTLGRYMLWEFRNDYRCCIIQKITSQTGDQLFRLFEYQDENRPKPLLILIDNGDDDHIFPLYEDLQKRKRSETEIFCVLLVCYRKTEIPANKIERNIFLTQKLSEPEVEWFKSKYQYLQDKFKEQGTTIVIHTTLDILLRILLNIVNKRAWNDTKRSQFSPLVVELISEGDTNSALDVLKTAYEITDNPIVAQQIS